MSSQGFQEHLRTLRHEVEIALQENLDGTTWPESLKLAVEYSLMAGGKRLRPVLVLLATEVCGADRRTALPAACAIEMIHTYSLIHDDLPSMDNDELRRGRPTSHIVFGEALAILAGDCLLTHAFETVSTSDGTPSATASLLMVLATAAGGGGMVGGQILDLEAERGSFTNQLQRQSQPQVERSTESDCLNSADSAGLFEEGPLVNEQNKANNSNCDSTNRVDHLTQIHTMKTGALISASLEMGAICAGASNENRQRLRQYGLLVGLAFQIADDLLDITGSNSKLGKTTGRDVDLGKLTYPSLIGIEASRHKAEQLVQQACDLLSPFGERAVWLTNLARFIVERDH